MAETVEIDKLIWLKRSSNYASLLSMVLYLPFGVVLGVLRLFVFLHASLLWFILPRRFPFKRLILRAMLTVTGLPISVQGEPSTDTRKKILIANHVTNLDPFIIALLNPSIFTFETPTCVYPKGNLQTYEIPADKDHSDVVLTVRKKVEENEDPLLFFPERLKTNGKASLLKFSLLPFETDYPIQPVTIQATRYLLDLNVSTYSSTAYEDLLLCFLSPLTLFTIKYLPVTEQKKEESKEEFAARVQANMAKSLGISTSQYTHHDVREYTKNLNVQEEVRVPPVVKKEPPKVKDPSPDSRPASASPDSTIMDSELEKMLKQVQDVLPDIPSRCILSDLRKTKDVDETITNILEGRVPTSPSAEIPAKDLISLSQGLSFKANSFESTAKARELSFAERKQAMLEAARLMYRIKKNL